jgi:hypothetical protein
MKTVQLLLSEKEYVRYASKKKRVRFRDVRKQLLTEAFQAALERSVNLATKAGISAMTVDDINSEIEKTRNASSSRN